MKEISKARHLHSTAVFLIALIVSLPIYSSIVFAGLSNEKLRGTEEPSFDGYIKDGETIHVSVDAEIEGEDHPLDVHLHDSGGALFQGCSEGYCYDIPKSSAAYPSQNSFNIKVALYDKNGYKNDEKDISGYKDVAGPKITKLGIEGHNAGDTIGGSEDIAFSYKIEDGSSGKCVGIKYLQLKLVGEDGAENIDINTLPGDCVKEDSFSGESFIDKIKGIQAAESEDTVEVTVEAVAYDNFEQESEPARITFQLDNKATGIVPDSFKLMDGSGNEVRYVSGGMKGSAYVEVEDAAGIENVRGDFSSLSEKNGIMPAVCSTDEEEENKEICKWDYVWIDIGLDKEGAGESATKDIRILLKDNLGNEGEITIPWDFEYDATAPSMSLLKTNYTDPEGKSYIGKADCEITLEIAEEGAGFSDKKVYLDMSSINGQQHVQADECEKEEGDWMCYWYIKKNAATNVNDVTAADGTYTISVKPDSADNLGNIITGSGEELSTQVIVDRTDPVIGDINYKPEEPVMGDLEFNFDVEDESPVSVSIDASSISGTQPEQGSCEAEDETEAGEGDEAEEIEVEGEDEGRCRITVDVGVSSYTEADVEITAVDAAGNKGTKTKKVIVYEASEDATPNLFSANNDNIEFIPSRIDKNIASRIPVEVFVHVILDKNEEDGEIIGITPECPDMSPFLEAGKDPELMNEYEDDPYIALKLDIRESNLENKLPIKCKLILTVKDDRHVYTKTEEEVIEADLELYGNSMGDIKDVLDEDIDRLNDDIEDIDEEIEKYQKWVDTWGVWCQVSEALGTLNSVLQTIKSALYLVMSIAWGICIIPGCKTGLNKLWGSVCTALSDYHSRFIHNFIWPTGIGGPVGMANKYACMVLFHCALCNINDYYDLAMDIAVYQGSKRANAVESEKGGRRQLNSDTTSTESGTADTYWEPGATSPPAGTTESGTVEGGREGTGNSNADRKGYEYYNYDKTDAGNPKNGAMIRETSTGREWTYNKENKKWERSYFNWESQAQYTTVTPDTEWVFNPYKSIHYAKTCLCIPGMIYNLRKKRQIKCMHLNCVKAHVKAGLPANECNVAYMERYCLYVEGAEYKKHGNEILGDNIWMWVKDNALFLTASIGYLATCWEYLFGTETVCELALVKGVPGAGWYPAACGLAGGALSLIEMNNIFESEFSFLNYDQELKGEDYCETGNY